MGERLINARHHAADVMQSRNKQLRERWEAFSGIVEDRHTIMELSVMFHDRQHKVLQQAPTVCTCTCPQTCRKHF